MNRYISILGIMLTALLFGGNAVAQVHVYGSVFGGGNNAVVKINTTVNISAGQVDGNVYGGGNLGDVGTHTDATDTNYEWTENTGDTHVIISGGTIGLAKNDEESEEGNSRQTMGNVFGGGKGKPKPDTFWCENGMVFKTNVSISNGTVIGSVYGGGEVGRVENNTKVEIGAGEGTSEPVIKGCVFGAGKGLNTHGYSALVRGNTDVTVKGNAKVEQSVYGGGEIASVGRYNVANTQEQVEAAKAEGYDVEIGMPYALKDSESGQCHVTIQGNAEIGLDGMQMTKDGGPDDSGYVFGAGKGILPYEDLDTEDPRPRRMKPGNAWEYYTEDDFDSESSHYTDYEAAYLKYIETLALATKTYVTIDGNAFVKGSVYGGSENGHVQHDTFVYIEGGQIGSGDGVNERYADGLFIDPSTATPSEIIASATVLKECAHWPYGVINNETGKKDYLPYDKYSSTNGGATSASDGHTFYGNVFGGGSGLYPYKKPDGSYEWLRSAGRVYGNTNVEITGGHILTSVYGGCELTDVGNGVSVEEDKGKCTVKMSGGTLGVPRTLAQIAAHPVTCYLFGAGKGDQRTRFNQWTNVGSVEVEITGGIIYGSVFGGGEDGHVLGDVNVTIGKVTTTGEGDEAVTTTSGPLIGTWGTSYVDGNVFGGGRGFGGDALTAGVICGNVEVDIKGGRMLGSIYGGGRLGSVGTYLVPANHAKYGLLIPDGKKVTVDEVNGTVIEEDIGGGDHGHITIGISGGTIGNDMEYGFEPTDKVYMPNTSFDIKGRQLYTKGGNVFTGCMGRLYALDGTTPLKKWFLLGKCKNTVLNVSGGIIKSSVYGGAELGTVGEDESGTLVGGTEVNITGGTIGTKIVNNDNYYYFGSVFGGGKGSTDVITYPNDYTDADKADISEAGKVYGDVQVKLNEGIDEDKPGGIVNKIFGCNDMNGTPWGNVSVFVYGTQNASKSEISDKFSKNSGKYDVEAVYGGGNLAAYLPASDNSKAKVTIEGCNLTSIETVYGGGNAAPVPATYVLVKSCYEIGTVFGGGNGADQLPDGSANPGANVGYKADGTTAYGTGEALAELQGGTVHQAFGGSNTKGNVRTSATVTLNEVDPDGCPLEIDEVYGAGNEAYQDGTSNINLGCISFLSNIYGGSKNANINNNIELTIQSGRFNRVFGGNNLGGQISGTITVNIEETGCHPIVIGQLFGGGNQAAYTAPEGQHGPTVNVKSFTSIGEIYGGGYGAGATVTGDTYVNINVAVGDNANAEMAQKIDPVTGAPVTTTDPNDNTQTIPVYTDVSRNTGQWIHFVAGKNSDNTDKIETVWQPEHKRGEIGTIGNVFGGGNAAAVQGNTNVTIGNAEYVEITTNIVAGDTDVRGYYVSNNSTYTEISGSNPVLATANTKYYRKVIGVNITGNVYGGGNAANVSGDTNVIIGKETTTP